MGGGEVVRNKKVVLRHYVTGFPKESDMEVVTNETLQLEAPKGSGAVMVKNLYLSCDPYMRSRMSNHHQQPSYVPAFVPGSVLTGQGVAKVVHSENPDFTEGELVWGMTGWEEYSLIQHPHSFFKIKHTDLPLSHYTGLLGMPGLTAYVGLYEICAPKKGDNVIISA